MIKKVFYIIFIFVLGMAGGIFSEEIFWPYFVEKPLFYEYKLEKPPIYMTEKKEIFIQENVAIQNVLEKIEKAVVGIETTLPSGKIIKGSGLVVTSDGLIVTLAEIVPNNSKSIFFIDGYTPSYQILKRDLDKNLVLIKLEQKNLSTIGFVDFDKIKLGQRVILFGMVKEKNGWEKVVNEGIIRKINSDFFETNFSEENYLKGGLLFNIDGEAMGLSLIDSKGKVSAVSVKDIKNFIGL